MGFAWVALLDRPFLHSDRLFTYEVPDGLAVAVGSLVRVPLRGKRAAAVVVRLLDEADVPKTFPIAATLGPGLDPQAVDLCRWVAARYLSTLGEALAAALPDRVASEEKVEPRGADPVSVATGASPETGAIARSISSRAGGRFVWRPGPGAPRGEGIVALVSAAFDAGGGALVLLPEVRVHGEVAGALASFGDAAGDLGSARSARDRYRDWLALRAGTRRLATGGRGAVFAPVRDLALIVVDDEAHASYKEGRAPRFDARAVAAERARRAGATIVLVGVPPSVEAHAACDAGSYVLVKPPRASERAARPPVTIVDRSKGERTTLVPDPRTLAIIRRAVDDRTRVVVLVHRGGRHLDDVTERMQRSLERPALRLDARVSPDRLERALHGAPLVVGTPYVAKDLAIEGTGLLVLVDVDAALSQAEFRAAEDTFASWWRAARWVGHGGIVIETDEPRHPAIAALARWDPDVLHRAEAARRKELGYPPFAVMARIDVPADRAAEIAGAVAATGIEVLGPVETPSGHVVVARAERRDRLIGALGPLVEAWRATDEPMRVDVDPREVLVPKWRSSRS